MKLRFDTHGNEKQKECGRAWNDPVIFDIVYGGAKGGAKSYTGSNLIFANAFTYPDTHYFIARKKLNDLRKFTIPTIHEVFESWKIEAERWKYNGQDNYFELYHLGFKKPSKVFLLEAAYMPSDELYARFGSMQMTQGWIEEAGEFEEAAKNNLAASIGRWKNDVYNLPGKLLQTCNPAKNYLYREYYRKYKEGKLEPWKKFIQALPYDNKMLPPGYIENLERTLNKNEKERLLKGNWEYDDDPAALMPYDKIVAIFSNDHVNMVVDKDGKLSINGKKKITVDVARFGGDRVVMIAWEGFRAKIFTWKKEGLDITAQRIERQRLAMGIGKSDVIVDEDGVGGGIVDFYKCKGFINNARPLPSPDGALDRNGKPIPENFDHLKSQCYFRFAKRVCDGGVYIDCDDPEIKQLVIEELEQVKQKALDSDMKKGVVPKEDVKELLGRSPDFADALMMREYFELVPQFTWTAF